MELVLLVLLEVLLPMELVVQGAMERLLVYLVPLSHTLVEAVAVDITHLTQQVALVVVEQDQALILLQQQEQPTQEAAVEAAAV